MTMLLDRRNLLSAPLLAAIGYRAVSAQARDSAGFSIDWQGGPQTPEVAESLDAQISLVRSLRIAPGPATFFAAQVITVDLAPDTHTRAGPRGVFFERKPMPAENPVLLHELLHRYHLLRLPQGVRNPDVLRYFATAKSAGFPPDAYMFKNPLEFFAMTASVVLWGKAARSPRTRDIVRRRMPDCYDWIVREFGLVV